MKTNAKTNTAAGTTNQLPDLPPEVSPAQEAIANDIAVSVLNQPNHGEDPLRQPMSGKRLRPAIAEAMGILAAALTEIQDRAMADNGKRYPLEMADRGDGLPDNAQFTGEIVEYNVYHFEQSVILSGIVKQAEYLLTQAELKVARQRQWARDKQRGLDASPPTATPRDVDQAESILDDNILTEKVRRVLFQQAVASYEELTGRTFETQAMKLERERMGKGGNANVPVRQRKSDAFED